MQIKHHQYRDSFFLIRNFCGETLGAFLHQHRRMASKMLRVALIALTVAHATAASDVLVINGPDDLTAAVKAHPFLAVEFYAPWW